MLQLIFDFEKDSDAEAKIATSFAPAATAASKPYTKQSKNLINNHKMHSRLVLPLYFCTEVHTLIFGVNTGNRAPSTFRIPSITSFASAN